MERGKIEFEDPNYRKCPAKPGDLIHMVAVPSWNEMEKVLQKAMDQDEIRLEEIRGQIAWFRSLLESIEAGKIEDAVDVVKAAIKLLERKL